MNWEYALGVIAVILIISYGTLAVLKKRGKADQANKRTLFISTVIAIGFALLTPIFAKTFSDSFNATVLSAIVIALVLCILLGVGVGVLTMIRRKQPADPAQTAPKQGKTQIQGIEEVQIQLQDLQQSDEDLAIGFAEGLSATDAPLSDAAATAAPEASASETAENVAAAELPADQNTEAQEIEAALNTASEASDTALEGIESPIAGMPETLETPVQDTAPAEAYPAAGEGHTELFDGTQWDSELEKIVDTERNTDRIGIEEDMATREDVAGSEAQILAKLAEAEDHKTGGRLSDSIACLYEVLLQKPEEKLSTLIVIEICSLSKKLDNAQYVRDLLESDAVSPLDETIKGEILSNI